MAAGVPFYGPVDLERLDAYLLSDNAPENSMGVSAIDGFLTGLVVGPELVMPSKWLQEIWGHEEPKFDDVTEVETILGIIMARYNEIIRLLNGDPPALDPIFIVGPEEQVFVTDWCGGFLDAAKLRPKAWEPLIQDRMAGVVMVPFFVLGGEPEDYALFGLRQKQHTDTERMRLLRKAPDLIIDCVFAIREYWRNPHAAAVPANRVGPRSRSERRRR